MKIFNFNFWKFSILCCFILATNICYAGEPNEPKGDGTEESPYLIYNSEELFWFNNRVNNKREACAKLMNDIVINKNVLTTEDKTSFKIWSPIGNSSTNYFAGIFDGNGYAISGLYINNEDNVGLFGYNEGTIKNLSIIDSYIIGENYVGSICGYNNGTIINCTNSGQVKGENNVGGVSGYNGKEFSNCTNKGKVEGTSNVGGVCGYAYNISECSNFGEVNSTSKDEANKIGIGGVIGFFHSGIISNCYNEGKVNGKNADNVGGVIGCNYNYSTNSSVLNCYNTGNVIGNNNVGGICGYNNGVDNSKQPITDCYNSGNIIGQNTVGGICGFNNNYITNCYNLGSVVSENTDNDANIGGICGNNTKTITNCYNTGNVSGAADKIGGICGNNINNISYCYNIGDVNGTSNLESIGGICGYIDGGKTCYCYCTNNTPIGQKKAGESINIETYTLEQFNSGEVSVLLNQNNNEPNWGQENLGNNKSFPTLYANKVYKNGDKYEYSTDGFLDNDKYEEPHKKNNVYQISKPGHLYWFAQYVNKGNTNTSANAALLNDIVINENVLVDGKLNENSSSFREWIPIAENTSTAISFTYKGTFDGNGYTISGLYFNNTKQDKIGVFSAIQNATIKNLGVIDSYFNGKNEIAGVCGYNNGGTITNCYNTSVVVGIENVGGVCGNNNGIIKYCYNSAPCKFYDGSDSDINYCYNNADFCSDNQNKIYNLSTIDFCNGALFEGFDNAIWTEGSSKIDNNGVITFTLPHFKDGYKPTIKGQLNITIKDGTYYYDTKFSEDNITAISITVNNNTYNKKENLILNNNNDLSQGIKGKFYEIPFCYEINLKEYTYLTEFKWNYPEGKTPTATINVECKENSNNNITDAQCTIIEDEQNKVNPTCTKDGKTSYIATYGKFTEKSNSIIIPALGHKFLKPTYSWTDYSKAEATFVCESGDTTIIVEGKITSEKTIEPTATKKGKMVYTATFEFNGETFTDKKEQSLDPTPTNEISQIIDYKVWGNNGVVYIETENYDSQVQIFDLNGRLIKSLSLTNNHSEIQLNKSGVFVVVINNTSFKIAL